MKAFCPELLLLTLATVACGQIVGIDDVPTPVDGGVASSPKDASGMDSNVRDATEASGDASILDAFGDQRSPGDLTSVPDDAAMESTAPDAGDTGGVDGAACAATWFIYGQTCDECGKAHCCPELAACEVVDDAGLDQGRSRCAALIYCIMGYTGTLPPGTGDTNCKNDGKYSPSELANEDAALSCIRASCSVECKGL